MCKAGIPNQFSRDHMMGQNFQTYTAVYYGARAVFEEARK